MMYVSSNLRKLGRGKRVNFCHGPNHRTTSLQVHFSAIHLCLNKILLLEEFCDDSFINNSVEMKKT